MTHRARAAAHLILALGVLPLGPGCAMFRSRVRDVDPDQQRHMTAKYDYTDLHQLTESVVDELLLTPLLAAPADLPLMRLGSIQNRTEQHVDTRALAERIRTLLIRSSKAQFVAEAQRDELIKEQDFQSRHGEKDTRVAAGRQANPQYMIGGALVEIQSRQPRQVRVSRTEIRYYNLTIEVTDLQSGLIVWTTEKRITRQASQPLIGW